MGTKIPVSMIEGLQTAGVYPCVGRAAAKSRTPVVNDLVYLIEGGRSGFFVCRTGTQPYTDEAEAVYFASGTAGFYYEREMSNSESINILWCGAVVGDNAATDNWTVFIQAFNLCGATGKKLYLPSGRYRVKTALLLNMTAYWTDGLTIHGDGHSRSIIDMRACTNSPNMTIYSNQGASYYLNMHDVGIQGNIPGYVVQIGKDDFSDPPNLYRFTGVSIANYDTSGAARGAKLNFVVGSWFDWQVGCGSGGYVGGFGVALTLKQCEFNQFFGSMGSAEVGVLFDGGHSFGNVFTTPDFENLKICVRFLSGTGGNYNNNTFIGGQWSYSFKGIDCQSGTKTMVINPTQTYNAPAGSGDFIGGSVGLQVL